MSGNNYDVTTVFKADITQFSDSVKSLQRYIQTVNSEFSAATNGTRNWEKSQNGLKTKLTQLEKVLSAQEKILEELQDEYKRVAQEEGESSEAAQKLAIQINKTTASIAKSKSDIDKYNKKLVELGSESKKGGKGVKDLGDKAKDSAEGFTVAKGAIAGFIANGLSALVGAAKNAITTVLGLADATREYRQTLATLDSAANDAGVSTDKVRDKFADLMGVFNDEGSVTEGLNNLLTAGFDEKSLDDITAGLEGASLKWKDTLKFEGLADSLQEWIGSGGKNLTGNFAELLERMGYNLEEVQEKTKDMTDEQRRTYVTNLLAAEGLNTVSEEYRKQNADMVNAQKANVDYQNTVAEMGAKVEPITTKIREGFTRILEKVLELLEGVDFDALSAKIDGAFDSFINDILPKIVDGIQWLIDNKDLVIAGIVGIGAAFMAWKAVGIIQSVIGFIKGLTTAQALLNAVMAMNPIGLVVAAIVGLVAAFVVLWKKCDGFRAFWINLWEGIKKVAKVAWDAIKGFFIGAWNVIKAVWDTVKPYFQLIWNNIKAIFSVVKNVLSGNFQGAWESIKSIFGNYKKFFTGVWTGIKNIFKSVSSWFGNIFKNAWSSIKNAFSSVGSFFGGIWDTIKSKFTSIGTKVGQAIGGAFKTAINAVIGTVEKGINTIPNAINKAIGVINKLPNVNISPMGTVSLPRLAKGGVVDKPTFAQIAEAGKEAVIPLENNTQGLKEIANLLAEKIGITGGGVTNNYYNTFNGVPTSSYALHLANKKGEASWKLLMASYGRK